MELNIKREPSVEYVVLLPVRKEEPLKVEEPQILIKACSVKVQKFDAKWKNKAKIYGKLFACDACKLVSRKESQLKKHKTVCKTIIDKSRRLICRFCKKKFTDMKSISSHARTKPIDCPSCDITLACSVLWREHKKEHHQNGFSCNRCTYVAKVFDKMSRHVNTHTKPFFCECGRRFADKEQLENHEMCQKHGDYSKSEDVSFRCPQCNKSFRTPHHLKIHGKIVHSNKKFECDICGKILKSRQIMIGHLETHYEGECKICRKLLSLSMMQAHMLIEHIKSERGNTCKNCGVRILKTRDYNTHINAKPVDCPSCHIMFPCHILRTKHETDHHQEGFKCSFCAYVGRTRVLIRKHNQSHTKKFACVTCDRMFAVGRHLERHQMHHKHGEYAATNLQFKCTFARCLKKFPSTESLEGHMRRVHQEVDRECDYCGGIFKGRANIVQHIRKHFKKECQICNKRIDPGGIRYHMRNKHNDE